MLRLREESSKSCLMSALSSEQIFHTGKACKRFGQNASGVKVGFEDGSTVEGDLLIAADGIHSAIRVTMLSNEK